MIKVFTKTYNGQCTVRKCQQFASVHTVYATLRGIAVTTLLALAGLLLGQSLAYSADLATAFSAQSPNIAFYYQSDLPVDELQMFDAVVIDPARATLPPIQSAPHTVWLARLDLKSFVRGSSSDANAFVQHVVAPLWAKGYRGFLLDDSAAFDARVGDADNRIGALLLAIRSMYPDARLILRNHLALAQAHAADLYALALDSVYHTRFGSGYGGATVPAPEVLRAEALTIIKRIQRQHALPVVALDYCAVGDQVCRRQAVNQISADGLTPYVTSRDMGAVGVGRIEVMPRKILMVQSPSKGSSLDLSVGVYDLSMPLNYLGYDVQYVDLNEGLPSHVTNDRYAGIVVAIGSPVQRAGVWREWLLARVQEGMRIAVLGQFGFPMDSQAARILGLDIVPGTIALDTTPQIVSKDATIGFEIMPAPDALAAVGIRVSSSGHSWLRLKAGGYVYDAAGLMPWGAYALQPFVLVSINASGGYRWVVQPIDFFRQALALPDMPVPDLTSENGRRLLFTHVDGDGFASRGEFAGGREQYSGQILYTQIFSKYAIPMSISVIEGEIGAHGMYSKLTTSLEPIARKIFALPNVEIASHTFSHPFFLNEIDNTTGRRVRKNNSMTKSSDEVFAMKIPSYKFDLDREISGSIDYINQKLAPPGKSVVALFWPGDAAAPAIALQKVAKAGVLNINGGDTVITDTASSWTNIAPYGVAKGDLAGEYQVYAGAMNENMYTNDWLGPYYGFRRVLETFEMTNKPIRFKPIDVYYHFYSGTKQASLTALRTVFDAVLKQPVMPIYTTDYIKRAMQWRHVGVARAGDRWLVRSGPDLRQLRWPGKGVPDLATSAGVAGYLPGPGGLYIHMGSDEATFTMSAAPRNDVPYIAEASSFVRQFSRRGRTMRFEAGGYTKPFVQFANAAHCRFSVDGRAGKNNSTAGAFRLDIKGELAQPVSYHLIEVDCE
ncbi:sugar ABC transporter [Pusillimonas sp. ANT_WB101]|uniref:sugar ABC transporter n=1 Tax=Pusillimonas sp. ANT_WB101 TaxID=2597356 RepID=UPI0011EEF0EF|nr:sugar ABC transporter [Pusillimonas sp. ANT_WB101]KAA0911090.1 sugar ABC transporter [Pusillimonas sp. ANT_WB101]